MMGRQNSSVPYSRGLCVAKPSHRFLMSRLKFWKGVCFFLKMHPFGV